MPVQVEIYSSTEDELEALVLSNASREKTTLQKAREGMILEEVERVRAKDRQQQTQLVGKGVQKSMVVDEPSTTIEQGKTRDIVAQKVGFKSGRQYERTRNVVKKIDGLKEKGNADDAELLTDILNKAPEPKNIFQIFCFPSKISNCPFIGRCKNTTHFT